MADTITKNLDVMVNIRSNMQRLTSNIQGQSGQISATLKSLEMRAADAGATFEKMMAIDMSASMKELINTIRELSSVMYAMGSAQADTQEKAQSFADNIVKNYKRMTDHAHEMGTAAQEGGRMVKSAGEETADAFKGATGPGGPIDQVTEFNYTLTEGGGRGKYGKISAIKAMREYNNEVSKAANNFRGLGKHATAAGNQISKMMGTQHDDMQRALTDTGHLRTAITKTNKESLTTGQRAGGMFARVGRMIGKVFSVGWGMFKRWAGAQLNLAKEMFKAVGQAVFAVGKVMWTVIKGPLKIIGNLIKYVGTLLGGLSFAAGIKSAIDLEVAANRMARTMVGGTESIRDFHRAQSMLMRDITNAAWRAGSSVQEMANIFEGLAAYHLPVKELKELGQLSHLAAKGLELSFEQATSLVGELRHIGKLNKDEITEVVAQFVQLQRAVGLSSSETQALTKGVVEFTRRVRAMGGSAAMIKKYTMQTNIMAAAFVKAGVDASIAAEQMQRLFDPERLEDNIVLYSKLGISMDQAMGIMQGAGEIPEDMAGKFIGIAKQITAMGPIAGREYAKLMGLNYGMAQQLGALTADQMDEANAIMKRGGKTAEEVLEEQRKRERETLKEQFEMTKNRLAIMFMETLKPLLSLLKEALKVINVVMEKLRPIMQKVSGIMMKLVDGAMKLMDPLIKIVTMFADVLFADDSPIFDTLQVIMQALADTMVMLAPIILEIVGALSKAFMGIIVKALQTVSKLLVAMRPFFVSIADFIGKIIGPISDIVLNLMTALQPVLVMLADIAGQFMEAIGDALFNLLNAIKGPMMTMMKTVMKLVSGILGAFTKGGKDSPLQKILGSLSAAFGTIGEAMGRIMETIAPLIQRLMGPLDRIIRRIGDLLPVFIDRFAQFFETFIQGMIEKGILDKLFQVFEKLMGLFATFLEMKLDKWMEKVFDKMEKFSGKGQGFLAIVLDVVLAVLNMVDKIMYALYRLTRFFESIKSSFAIMFDDSLNLLQKGAAMVEQRRKRKGSLLTFEEWQRKNAGMPSAGPLTGYMGFDYDTGAGGEEKVEADLSNLNKVAEEQQVMSQSIETATADQISELTTQTVIQNEQGRVTIDAVRTTATNTSTLKDLIETQNEKMDALLLELTKIRSQAGA